jgi:FlaA1/EpsC-like NDP-sugar epimerase
VRELRRNLSWGYWPVAFLDDDPEKLGRRVSGLPVLGRTDDLPLIVRREQIQAVVLAIPSAPQVTIQRIANLARQTPARVLTMSHIGALLRGEARDITLQQVAMTDVLGRPVVEPDVERCRAFVAGRRILVTGAAGSIGRELVRQVAQMEPALLVGLDINESDLFDLQQELTRLPTAPSFQPVIASVTNRPRLAAVFAEYRPEIVFHAAAYKHVPMMEAHPQEAVIVNVVGTYETARVAAEFGVERFVLVSTDKAVRPKSVMGATKRLAEHAVRAVGRETGLSVCAVRFGNVLGSRGSVVPLFEQQIAAGGPVTVTHPEVRRYFMTIPEAAGLIIHAGAFGDRDVIYMLDMGEEILIRELAERMIRLRGLRVGEDIAIVYTGLRPGEKLREDLAYDFEQALPTPHPQIRILAEPAGSETCLGKIEWLIAGLAGVTECGTAREVRRAVMRALTELDGPGIEVHEPVMAAEPREAVHAH